MWNKYPDYVFDLCCLDPIAPPGPRENGSSDQARTGLNDTMMLDDTKHTVYIHDLDREIEEQDHEDGSLRILSGLGGGLSTIPRIFTPQTTTPQGKELVLYRDPISLTVPKEFDIVERASIETRERVRGEQPRLHKPPVATNMGLIGGPTHHDTPQEDQMDVDNTGN